MGPILPAYLADMVHKTGGRGGCGGIGSRATAKKSKGSPMGVNVRMQVSYDLHLPALSLWDREKSHSVLVGTVLPTLHDAVLCKNWHLCGCGLG